MCAACMHRVRLRLARRTAISMAPPQQSAPRIRAAYRAGGRRLSHFTHARSGTAQSTYGYTVLTQSNSATLKPHTCLSTGRVTAVPLTN